MENKFIPSIFNKALEERGAHSFSVEAVIETLKILESEYLSLCSSEGSEVAETVFSYKTVKRALQQCLAYHQNTNLSITYEDNIINYEYAYWKLQEAERIAEEE